MKSLLSRTVSTPLPHPVHSGSRKDAITGTLPYSKTPLNLHMKTPERKIKPSDNNKTESRSIQSKASDAYNSGPLMSTKTRDVLTKELSFSGDGFGKGRGGNEDNGKENRGDNHDDKNSKLGAYYRELLKSNPNNSLLLMNYGKFLYEVEKDAEKSEEYYCRSILAEPEDGEVFCLYGKLIWETQRDKVRAKTYFDRAVCVSPDDCMVSGAYAKFMWETEDDEMGDVEPFEFSSPAMVGA